MHSKASMTLLSLESKLINMELQKDQNNDKGSHNGRPTVSKVMNTEVIEYKCRQKQGNAIRNSAKWGKYI